MAETPANQNKPTPAENAQKKVGGGGSNLPSRVKTEGGKPVPKPK